MNRQKFAFSRKINLGPAIGDWTTIQYREAEDDEFNVSNVRDINFDSLAKNKLKDAHYIHYRLAERVINYLSDQLNAKLELHSVYATQVAYSDFLDSMNEKSVQMDIDVPDLGSLMVVYDWAFVAQFVDRLTGGAGIDSQKEDFSKLELNILDSQLRNMVFELISPWGIIGREKVPTYSIHNGNIIFDKRCSARDAYILFTINFYFGEGNLRKIIMVYSNHMLRKLMLLKQKLTTPPAFRPIFTTETAKSIMVPVRVDLGSANIKMKELKDLKVGDVVTLGTSLSHPLKLFFGNNVEMLVQPGIQNSKYSVQILRLGAASHNNIPPKVNTVMPDDFKPVLKESAVLSGKDLLMDLPTENTEANLNSNVSDSSDSNSVSLNDNDSLETQPLSQISEESLSKEEEDENDLLDSNIEQPSIVSDESDENQTSANLFQETSDLVENDSLVVEEEGSIVEDDESAPISDLDDSESDNVDEVYSFDEDELDERD